MAKATRPDKAVLRSEVLDQVTKDFGLSDVHGARFLPDGLMNQNWRLETAAGDFALKLVTDVPVERLQRNLAVLGELAAEGVAVAAPVETLTGGHVRERGGHAWCLFPWAAGTHVTGVELGLAEVSELGAQLGELHLALDRICGRGLLPEVPTSLSANATSPERAAAKAVRLAELVVEEPSGSPFDSVAAQALEQRLKLLSQYADLRPEETAPEGAHGWTHGDFQYRNLLWDGHQLAAILDWDRLGVRPYAEEVARTAQVQFGVGGVFDLDRVVAFVAGYRSAVPLSDRTLLDGARRLWWKRMTDFWQLEFHYLRGDDSFDELFTADEALLHWWTGRLGQVEAAFTGG